MSNNSNNMHQKLERTGAKQSIANGKDAYNGTWNIKGSIIYHLSILLLAAIPSEGSSAANCTNLQHYPKLSQSEVTILYHDKKIFNGCCWKFINGLKLADEAVVFWLEHQVLGKNDGGCSNSLKFPEESYRCEPDIKNNICWVYTKGSGSCTIDQIKMALAPKNLNCSLTLQKLESTDGTKLDPEVCFYSKGAEAMFELHYFPVTCFDPTTRMTESNTTLVVAEKTESVPTIPTSTSETSLTSIMEKSASLTPMIDKTKKFSPDTSIAELSKTTLQTTEHESRSSLSTANEILDNSNSELPTQKPEKMPSVISTEYIITIAAVALTLLLIAISAILFYRHKRKKQHQLSRDKSTSAEGNIAEDEPSNSYPTDDESAMKQNQLHVPNIVQGHDTSKQEDVYAVVNKQTKINEVESSIEQKIGNAESNNDARGDIYATVQKK